MRKALIITVIIFNTLLLTNLSSQSNTWEKVTDKANFSARSGHQVLVFKNKLFIIGGSNAAWVAKKDVWTSENGKDWILLNSNTGITPSSSAVFHDTLWAETGKDIWNSADGSNWKKVTSIPEMASFGKRMIAFNNKLWIIAGTNGTEDKNDVWSSDNGHVWKKISTSSCFSPRFDVSLTVFDNKLWIIGGGQEGAKNLNDVWCTADGTGWEKICNAPFVERHVSQTIVYQNKIWLIGGFNGINLVDIWISPDGKNWEQYTNEAPFGARQEHAVAVFNNKMWLIGGKMGTSDLQHMYVKNDVWVYKDEETSGSFLNNEKISVKAFPNPIIKESAIKIFLPEPSLCKLELFNSIGLRVADLFNGYLPGGTNSLSFDPSKYRLKKGYYLLKTYAGSKTQLVKIIVE